MQAGSLRELHTFQHHLSITKTPDLPSTGMTCCTFKYMVTNFNNVKVNQAFLLDIHFDVTSILKVTINPLSLHYQKTKRYNR